MLLSREITVPVGHSISNNKGLRVEPGIERGRKKFFFASVHPCESNPAFVLPGQLFVVLHGALIVDTLARLASGGTRTVYEKENPDLVMVDRTAC